jgi:hypothetical protein
MFTVPTPARNSAGRFEFLDPTKAHDHAVECMIMQTALNPVNTEDRS